MPGRESLPSTLRRSPKKAQRTWIEAHDSAVDQYGEGERAHRTAFAAVKRGFEKVGDHWEAKPEPGPSEPERPRHAPRSNDTAGGVDTTATKEHLYGIAKRLGVPGRSTMTKAELITAIQRANDRETSRAAR